MALLPVADAKRRLLALATKTGVETVPLSQAAGRVLAAPLTALRTQPPFPASAMDGYAVRATDVQSVPVTLNLIGQSAAGHGYDGVVRSGETVRIFTGAPVPEGADSILIQENAKAHGNDITALEPVNYGRFVRPAGLDFAKGDELLTEGRILDASALSLAAAANHASLLVRKRPKVAVLATGDELLEPGSEPGPGQIIASNSYGVAAITRLCGAEDIDLGIAPDSRQAIAASVHAAIEQKAEILVTLGGASVGDHDFVQEVLQAEGMKLDFWRIAMRPGKPLMVGKIGDIVVLGLPGNPVSSLVCSHLFLKPLIAAMLGSKSEMDLVAAQLGADMGENDEREDYVRARLTRDNNQLIATPFSRQDSSMLKTLADADCLIVRKPHAPAEVAGGPCHILMLR